MNAANLMDRAWLPSDNQRRSSLREMRSRYSRFVRLSRPRPGAAMVVIVETGDPRP
jgi:hypothetical protein